MRSHRHAPIDAYQVDHERENAENCELNVHAYERGLTFDMSGRPRLAVGCPLDGMVRPTTVAEGANWQSKNADLIEGAARTAKRSTTTCGDSAFVSG